MRWNKKISTRPYSQDIDVILSQEIVYEAYYEGYINWNVYQKALVKIKTNINGSWMFEQPKNENNEK